MTVPNEFLQMAFVLAVTVAPIVLAIRLLAGLSQAVDGLVRPAAMGWPRGVQEEEPLPWKFGAAAD